MYMDNKESKLVQASMLVRKDWVSVQSSGCSKADRAGKDATEEFNMTPSCTKGES